MWLFINFIETNYCSGLHSRTQPAFPCTIRQNISASIHVLPRRNQTLERPISAASCEPFFGNLQARNAASSTEIDPGGMFLTFNRTLCRGSLHGTLLLLVPVQ